VKPLTIDLERRLPYDAHEVSTILAGDPRVLLDESTYPGRPSQSEFTFDMEVGRPGLALRTPATIHFGSAIRLGPQTDRPMSVWPAISRRLLPSFEGSLRCEPDRDGHTTLRLTGKVRPPFGTAGAALHRVLGQRKAKASLERVLDAIVRGLNRAVLQAYDAGQGATDLQRPTKRSPRGAQDLRPY
jgi:hypothetical protein